MYSIERKSSGYLLTFGGFMANEEMTRWFSESQEALARERSTRFGVIVDMRTLAPLPAEAQETMVRGQQLFKEEGMERSAVVLNNTVTTLQFKRLARESGICQWERYIDASATPGWAEEAVAWVRDGKDPDKN